MRFHWNCWISNHKHVWRCVCSSSASPCLNFLSQWTIISSSYTSRSITIAIARNNFTLSPSCEHKIISSFLSLLSTLSLSLFSAHSTVGRRGLYKLPSPSLAFNGDRPGFKKRNWLIWSFCSFLISTILQFALTPLLTKVVKLSTPLIGVLSAVSKASYYVLIANTKSRTMVSSRPKTLLTSKQWWALVQKHCWHWNNGECSSKNIVNIKTMVSSRPKTLLTLKRFQTYLACLACLEGGVGNIVSRWNCHSRFPCFVFCICLYLEQTQNLQIQKSGEIVHRWYSRSMLAQLVPQRELGKVYGLLAILDASLPFIG